MKNRWSLMGLAALAMSFALVGCTPEARSDYDKAGEKIAEGASTDAQKTEEAVERGAQVVEENVENAAENAREAAAAAEMTTQVKTALTSAENLSVEDLNVDTKDKTVYLRGRVDTASNKARAESIAKGVAGSEYTVKNELVVGRDDDANNNNR